MQKVCWAPAASHAFFFPAPRDRVTSFLSLLVPTPPSPKRTLLSKSSSILVQGAEVLGTGARRPCPRSEGDLDGDAGQHEGEEACGTRKLGGQGPEFAALEAGPSAAQHRLIRHGARLLSHIFETRPVCVVTQPGPPVGHRSRGARLGQPQPSQALLTIVARNLQRAPGELRRAAGRRRLPGANPGKNPIVLAVEASLWRSARWELCLRRRASRPDTAEASRLPRQP